MTTAEFVCCVCSKKFMRRRDRIPKFLVCSRDCRALCRPMRVLKDRKGYLYFYDYLPARKKVFIHRLKGESLIGRKLLKTEAVHHIDGNRQNNSSHNLEIMSRKDHARFHRDIFTTLDKFS